MATNCKDSISWKVRKCTTKHEKIAMFHQTWKSSAVSAEHASLWLFSVNMNPPMLHEAAAKQVDTQVELIRCLNTSLANKILSDSDKIDTRRLEDVCWRAGTTKI